MVCEHATRAELSGYADGELPVEERRWWDEHLRICAPCREVLARTQAVRTSLRHHLPPREPSSAFREELRQLIRSEQTAVVRPTPARRRSWPMALGGALAATLVFALGLAVGRVGDGGGPRDPIVAQVVAGHVRSLEVDHLVDVASSEHHVVKPWFAGKLGEGGGDRDSLPGGVVEEDADPAGPAGVDTEDHRVTVAALDARRSVSVH